MKDLTKSRDNVPLKGRCHNFSRDNVPLNPGKCEGSNKCYAIPNSCLPYRSRITKVCHQSVYCVYAWGDFGREYQLMCRIGLKILFKKKNLGGGFIN